jgi:PAS domain S-box-containing protein
MPYIANADLKKPTLASILNLRRRFGMLAGLLLVFLACYLWLSWQNVKKEQSSKLSSIAELSGNSLDSYFAHYENSLKVLAEDLVSGSDSINLARSQILIKQFLKTHPDLLVTNVLAPDGQMLLTTEELAGNKLPSQGNAPSFIIGRDELQKGVNFNVGRVFYGPLIKEWIIPLRYAVRDKNGGLLYIVTTALPLTKFQNLWTDYAVSASASRELQENSARALPVNTTLGLVRDDEFLISRYPAFDKAVLKDVYSNPRVGVLIEHLKKNDYPLRGDIAGVGGTNSGKNLYSFRRLSHHPITLFVTIPLTNVSSTWKSQVWPVIAIWSVLVLAFIVVYFRIEKNQLAWDRGRELTIKRLESIYNGSNDAFLLLAYNTITDCNSRAVEIFGLESKSEILSRKLWDFSPPTQLDGQESRLAATELTAKAQRVGKSYCEWTFKRKDGLTFTAEVLLSSFCYDGVWILQVSIRDINLRKKV